MHSNKDLLLKGFKRLGYTTLLMFAAPFAIYQAFKNENHPLHIPVLILGVTLVIAAIVMAFYAIKTIMDGLFDTK